MKRVAIADIHLSAYKNDQIEDDGLPYRLGMLIKVVRSICKFCRTNDIENIDILGDLYNDNDIIYTDSFNSFSDIILEFDDIKFTILSGNHDMSSIGEAKTSAVCPLNAYSNVTIVDKTSKKICDNVIAVPWTSDIAQKIKTAEGSSILLSHFGLSEAQLASGISVSTGITMTDLSKYQLALLGHYHKPQELKGKNTHLFYVGSPIHIDWNDKNQKKRFLVYDTETLEVKSVPISGFKQFREFEITDDSDVSEVMNEAMELKSEGHNVRVKNLTENEVSPSDDEIVVLEESSVDPTDRGIKTSMSTEEKMKGYLDIKNVKDEEREDHMKIGSQLVS